MKNLIAYALGAALLPISTMQAQQSRPNVLFIAIDDLRPELNCFGSTYMHTPNFDKLAAMGTTFERAYCQQAVSAATRNSLLTGLRPDAIGIYDLGTFFRKNVPDVVTLPQYFKQNGYRVEGVGKIYHTGHGNQDDKASWNVKWSPDKVLGSLSPKSCADTTGLESDMPRVQGTLLPYYATNIDQADMGDSRSVKIAIDRLKELKDQPFFMAVGLSKPHLPFVAPKRYWDMYNPKDIVIPDNKEPKGIPAESLAPYGELRKYYGVPADGPIGDEQARNLIHGYRACVSYVDDLVGQLLVALKDNGVLDNTIIVLWGDHGWKLGEYGSWCKHSNMEFDTNAPLIISAPGYAKGQNSRSLVEYVDIYPTLCRLAGLPEPPHLQGTSLLPVLTDSKAEVKDVAISQYPRENNNIMGYSLRTDKYRYTRWVAFHEPGKRTISVELYDHSNSKLAEKNLALLPEYKAEVKKLDKRLSNELAKYKNLQQTSDKNKR